MARSVYVTAPEGLTGKSAVVLGLAELFQSQVGRVRVFRPVPTRPADERDHVLDMLRPRLGQGEELVARGLTYDEIRPDPEAALSTIIDRYRAIEHDADVVIVVGSDFVEIGWPSELDFNARLAANLGAPVLLTVDAMDRSPEQVARVVDVAQADIAAQAARTVAVVVKGATDDTQDDLRRIEAGVPLWVMQDIPLLEAPTLAAVLEAVAGELVAGDPALLVREMEDLLVAGMTPEHCLDHLREGQVVVTPGDRPELLITLLTAHRAAGFPSLTGILLNGGYRPSPAIMRLLDGIGVRTPIIATPLNTYRTAREAAKIVGHTRVDTARKAELSLSAFLRGVDGPALLHALDVPRSDVVTPLMFQSELMERARARRMRIVLPEPGDDRVLQAASRVLAADVADVVLLGDETATRARAAELGLDLSAATVVATDDPAHLDRYAEEYARLRAKKGVTLEQARDTLHDVSYFGTMMVHLGDADGMVSGAAHTTAHTILPSFQIVRTRPGTSIVSSVFLMCLRDRVLVYGDCAVNPDPTAEQLADIAISSAETAAAFDIEPRVAMLSYSTGESGSGADVDKVREATRLVRQRRPDLSVEGPIQYDAAVDMAVASKKLPGSDVAGRATVFVFPDLNTGNNTYKAVQRSAGALAIGPVLQGLNKPVNDLSRGALVDDIVNTIAITAVQAQQLETQGEQQ